MGTQIVLSNTNYAGFIADITFSAQTGGTISLGSHLTPYTVDLDYYYGTYELYYSAFNQSCYVSIFPPTPTPTTTPTPTPTPTFFSYKINPSTADLNFCSRLTTTEAFVNSSVPLTVGLYYCSTYFSPRNAIYIAQSVSGDVSYPYVSVGGGPYVNCQGQCQ